MSTFNPFDLFIDSGRNPELFNIHFSVPSRNHPNATTNSYFSHFDRVPSQEPTSSQQQSHDRSISSRDASSPVQPRSSVASHLPPDDRPNIIEPDEDESVERRLLDHLAEMSLTLCHTYHRAWTREQRVQAIMSRELLTVGYGHIKAKMNRGDTPLSDLHYGSARMFLKIGPVSDYITPVEDVERFSCWNQKAIEIIDRWPTFDDFYDVWNGVLNRASPWDKIIIVREYKSGDYGVRDRYPCYPTTNLITLNRDQLEKYWSRASERVEALKNIDRLRNRFRNEFVQEFNRRRRYRRQIEELTYQDRAENPWRYNDRNVRRRFV
jgi:hypothetical protein